MRTKRKLWWALGSLFMVAALVTTSITLTIAALQAQVNSGFTISYTAKNINAAVFGGFNYLAQFQPEDALYADNFTVAPTQKLTFKGADHISFDAQEGEANKTFDKLTYDFNTSDIVRPPEKFYNFRTGLHGVLDIIESEVGNYEWTGLNGTFWFVILNFGADPFDVQITYPDYITPQTDIQTIQPCGFTSLEQFLAFIQISPDLQFLCKTAEVYDQEGIEATVDWILEHVNDYFPDLQPEDYDTSDAMEEAQMGILFSQMFSSVEEFSKAATGEFNVVLAYLLGILLPGSVAFLALPTTDLSQSVNYNGNIDFVLGA